MSTRKPAARPTLSPTKVVASSSAKPQSEDSEEKLATLSSIQLVSVNSRDAQPGVRTIMARPKREIKPTKRLIEDEENEEEVQREKPDEAPRKVSSVKTKRVRIEIEPNPDFEMETENTAPEEQANDQPEDAFENKYKAGDGRELLACDICQKSVMRKNMSAHVKTHASEKEAFACSECGKTFTKLYSMKRHIVQKHGKQLTDLKDRKSRESSYQESEENLEDGEEADKEKKEETGEFTCDYCGKQFLGSYWLTKHLKNVHADEVIEEATEGMTDKEYITCGDCGKVVKKRYAADHQRTHVAIKRLPCELCGKEFGKSYSLRRHMLSMHPDDINERAKVVACDVCGKTYTHPSSLHYHKLGHSDKRHVCECGEKFRTNSALKKHKMIHSKRVDHTKPTKSAQVKSAKVAKRMLEAAKKRRRKSRGIECKVCGAVFRDLDSLAMHLEMHTPDQFTLAQEALDRDGPRSDSGDSEAYDDIIDAAYADIPDEELDLGNEAATMYCGHCDESFNDIKEMSAHFVKHHEESLSNKTEEFLTTDVEKATAIKEGEYGDGNDKIICAICDTAFETMKEMKGHMVETHPEEMSSATRQQLVKDTKKNPATIPERLSSGDLLIENLSCGRCDETFTFLSDLNMHIFDSHLEMLTEQELETIKPKSFGTKIKSPDKARPAATKPSRAIYCGHCEESFSKINEMNAHIVEKHSELVSPEVLVALKTSKPATEDSVMVGNCKNRVVDPKRRPRKSRKLLGTDINTTDYVTCQHCDSTLRRDGMKQHMNRVHFKIANEECEVCEKRFYDKNSLRRHKVALHRMELDLQEPCFKCSMCDASYTSRSSLHSHVQSKHNPVTYSCWCCGREFRELSILNKHMLLHDDNAVRCRLCRFVYKDWDRLAQHVRRVHPDVQYQHADEIGFVNISTEPVSVTPKIRTKEFTLPKGSLPVLPMQTEIRLDGTEELVDDGSIMVVELNDGVLDSGEYAILEEQGLPGEGTDGEIPDVYLCQICSAGFHDSNALIAHCVTVHPDTLKIVFEEGQA